MKSFDDQICKCFGLFVDDLSDLIEIHGYSKTEDLSEDFGYGTKCGKCLDEIESIILKKNI